MIAEDVVWREVPGFKLLFREWTHLSFRIGTKVVTVYKNGEKI
jgi:hypothetical protein